jgi:hypothetical protein
MKCKKRKNTYFHNALRYFGIENFEFSVIDTAQSIEELNEKEIYWIDYYKSTNKKYGYNLDSGGNNSKKSDSTNEKIRRKKLENWQDEKLKVRMKNGLEKATKVWKETCPRKTKKIICKNCGKMLELSLWESKRRRFCSTECANSYNIKKATEKASIVNRERCISLHKEIRKYVLNWAKQNKNIINTCRLNKISSDMKLLIEETYKIFGIKDLRTISKAVVGEYSKKKLIEYLKGVIN